MKKLLSLALALCMLLILAAGCGSSGEKADTSSGEIALAFVFKNKTGTDLKEAYVYPTGADKQGDNLLKETWANNTDSAQYLRVIVARPEADTYDITTVASDGTKVTYPGLALKFNNSVSMKEGGEISVKNDSEVNFSEDDLKAAGLTCSFAVPKVDASKTAKLAFMFKNKTGKDVQEAYVYPTGYDDKMGESVVKDVWKNNTSDDMYLWLTLDRPDADVYDILVKFTDGSQLKYSRLDLKNSNSASMKDDKGTMSLKYDDTIGADGKPVAAASGVDASAATLTLRFIFKNKTGLDCTEAYVYPTGGDKGENVLKEVWKNNESDDMYLHMELARPNAPSYEIEMKFSDGSDHVFPDLDLVNNNNVSIKGSPIGAYLKFVDGAPVTSAADAAAAPAAASGTAAASGAAAPSGAAATSGDATLAFVFKNKTGLTMTGAYVYPKDAADKGSNILSSNFENNTDKSMYRRMVMTRPAADKYTLYCEFSDGSNATFDNLDLMHKNSVSVKGLDEISPKTDTEVSFTDAEIAATLATGVAEEAAK
jgi:hypothetical protein